MDIQTLIAGSARIDRLRKEIAAVTNLVLKGLLTADDYAKQPFHIRGTGIILADLPHGWWNLSYCDKPKLSFYWKNGDGSQEMMCYLPEDRVALPHVERVHANLGSFVEGISKAFPSLKEHWKYIRHSAKEELKIVYSINLNLEDGPVTYYKLANLPFPLPIGTQMFLSVEGEIVVQEASGKRLQRAESDTFIVAGYKHSAYDEFGYLNNDWLDIELEPEDKEESYTNNILVSLLEANGWKKKDY
ncbi:MAG: hypothetical protein KA066_02085 [Candidatus Pacebacteria bacterium]|nr:hypothetical protein [Candidatus Paceibacterota bacterium]